MTVVIFEGMDEEDYSVENYLRKVATKTICECIKICPDIKKLREYKEKGEFNEDLEEQYIELCSTGGFRCSQRDEFTGIEKKIIMNKIYVSSELFGKEKINFNDIPSSLIPEKKYDIISRSPDKIDYDTIKGKEVELKLLEMSKKMNKEGYFIIGSEGCGKKVNSLIRYFEGDVD